MKTEYIKASDVHIGDTFVWRAGSSVNTPEYDYRSALYITTADDVEEAEINNLPVIVFTGNTLTPTGYIPIKEEMKVIRHPEGKVVLPVNWMVLLINRKGHKNGLDDK
jgi:hypothetical protein